MGLPPFDVAEKTTGVPAQTELELAVIDTAAATDGATVIVIEFDVAGDPVTQAALEVTTHVITSPLFGEYVYVLLFVPAFIPLTFHRYAGEVPPFVGVAV